MVRTLTIPFSETLLAALNRDMTEIAAAMRREYALKLFREGQLTLTQSAELCGVDIYRFMSIASNAGIPIIDYNGEELADEFARLQAALP
ncbi:MAG: UPF0175 family protein [Treponematales bacterium]